MKNIKLYIIIIAILLIGNVSQFIYYNSNDRDDLESRDTSATVDEIPEIENNNEDIAAYFMKEHLINFNMSLYTDTSIEAEINNILYLTDMLESLTRSIEDYKFASYLSGENSTDNKYLQVVEKLDIYREYLNSYKIDLINNNVFYKTDDILVAFTDLVNFDMWTNNRYENNNFSLYSINDLNDEMDFKFDKEWISKEREVKKGFDGNGTEEHPYLIYDEEDLHQFVATYKKDEKNYYKLMSDIDVKGILYPGVSFIGEFDGNGYEITNLKKPLFGELNGIVKNLSIIVDICEYIQYGENMDIGGIARKTEKDAEVFNCSIGGRIEIYSVEKEEGKGNVGRIGGITGYNEGYIHDNKSNIEMEIKGESTPEDSDVINCVGQIVGANYVGFGKVGDNTCNGTIEVTDGILVRTGEEVGEILISN